MSSKDHERTAAIPTDVEGFSDLLLRSQLISAEQLRTVREEFESSLGSAAERKSDISSFMAYLVSQGLLTAWQGDKLARGKWKGFVLERYLLLEQLEKEELFTKFRARDLYTMALVEVDVMPSGAPNTEGFQKFGGVWRRVTLGVRS